MEGKKMNKLDKAIGGMDVIDVITNIVDSAKRKAATPAGYVTTIDINGYEFDCIVDYELIPACRGGRGDYGQQTEPDEQADIEMGQVWIFTDKWEIVDIPETAMTGTLEEILEAQNG